MQTSGFDATVQTSNDSGGADLARREEQNMEYHREAEPHKNSRFCFHQFNKEQINTDSDKWWSCLLLLEKLETAIA